jgi:hypothetical protein
VAAQNAISSGAIAGRVSDASGAAVPGATVVASSNENGLEQQRKTKAVGLYTFPVMRVGTYTLRVSHDGFKTTEVRDVVVQIGQTTTVDPLLEVGPLAQQVLVEATTAVPRPTESSVSTVVPRALIENLPLSGRRYTDFVLLAPNVTTDGEFGSVSVAGQQGAGGFESGYTNANGANSFTVDGANATSNFIGGTLGLTRVPYIFGEQSIEEFQVAVSPYSAVYGGAGTGFINTVTKSGTDSFHGNAFYYLRHSATGANDAVDNANGIPRPLNVLQQFGADLGGPLLRRKLWFYFDYEQQRQKNPISVINPDYARVGETFFLNVAPATLLPSPNGPFPLPGSFNAAPLPGDPNYPTYLQQVSNALNAIHSGLGQRARRRDDLVFFPKVDWQPTAGDHFTFVYNYNRFDSPGGAITFNPVTQIGISALPDTFVRDHHASIHWTHIFRPNLLNDFHASFLRDDLIVRPSGLIDPNFPSVLLVPMGSITLGNAPFSHALGKEFQWEFGERLDWTQGRHNLQLGLDINRTHVTDSSPFLFLGFYEFLTLTDFAIGRYEFFIQNGGNLVFPLTVPYYGFYIQDKLRARANLTFDVGVREDLQVFPQPDRSPAFPLAGQYPNQYLRLAPRFGFAYQARQKTVVRGGFGLFYEVLDGINYESAVITNGAPTHKTNTLAFFDPTQPANQQAPTFPNRITNPALFATSSNISLVHPDFRTPYVMGASLEIQQQLGGSTTLSVGTMWTHGVHLISSTADDLNLKPPKGTTTYVVCPPGTTTVPCSGRTLALPNLDAGLLQEGAVAPNLGQLNALISPGLNHYNSLYVQLQRRLSSGLAVLGSYTFSKNILSNGADFWNQFDLRSARGPSLLDQRHRLSVAAIFQSGVPQWHNSAVRKLLSDWTLSTVMQFNSGRPYPALLSSACTSSTLSFNNCDGHGDLVNDGAALESTANTNGGIDGTGSPSPAVGLNSFYGPWIAEVDLGLARLVRLGEKDSLTFKAQAFNLFNRANFFVQNGGGINAIQYNPIGTSCGDGMTLNQLCYLVPNPTFQTLQSVSQANGPRILQFGIQYRF